MVDRLIALVCLVSWVFASAASGESGPVGYSYDLPPQPSLQEMEKTDADRTVLTDGNVRSDGAGAVWGKWNVKPYLVDWTFDRPVRVRAIKLAIVHPREDRDNIHPRRVQLFGSDGGSEYLQVPDAVIDIPFQVGKVQRIELPVPGEGVVVKELRMRFESTRSQTVLTEVGFDLDPVDAETLAAAQAARVASQPPPLQPVVFPPVEPGARAAPPAPFFGVCGHMLHTDIFTNKFSPYWRLENTLPWVVGGGFGSVREALYLPLLGGEDEDRAANGRTVGENRRIIEGYFDDYRRHGVRVLLAPMFSGFRSEPEKFASFMTWIGEVSKRYDNIIAVEMHNEPNLRGFWKHTIDDYVEASRQAARFLRATGSTTPIIVGSFAGWGGVQHSETDIAYAGGNANEQSWRFAEAVFRRGALEFADAVSAHPYRNSSPPEGGLELESPRDPDGFEKEIRRWWEMVESHRPSGRPLKFYITEIGYSSASTGYAAVGSVKRQADYLSRLMLILHDVRLSGIPLEGVYWYDLKCDDQLGSEYEANFGIVANDLSHARPGFLAYRRIAEAFNDVEAFERLELRRAFSNWGDVVKSYTWRRNADGAVIVPFWRLNTLQSVDEDFASEMTLALPEGAAPRTVILHDLHEDRPREVGFRWHGGELTVPLWVRDRAAWLEVLPR